MMVWSRTGERNPGRQRESGGCTDERRIAVRAFAATRGISNIVVCAVACARVGRSLGHSTRSDHGYLPAPLVVVA
jgi:hypothetical protein